MKLDINALKSITFGAVDYETTENGLSPYRLTEEQKSAFIREQETHVKKINASAGVRFDFVTDSQTFKFSFSNISSGSSRFFYSFDLYQDNEMVYSYYNDYRQVTQDEFTVALSKGEKHIRLFFPNLCAVTIVSLELDDGAKVIPFTPNENILMYGDSITHGYDAVMSSLSYANLIASKLDAHIVNAAIGGAIFNSEVIVKLEDFTPDKITVAYGTNDWSKLEGEVFRKNLDDFLKKLKNTYPGVPAYFVLPIWRGDCDRITGCGSFDEHRAYMAKEIEKYGYVALESIDFVPHDARMFSPDLLHPNDIGFHHYANNLVKYLK